jgi:DNA-binding LacI/PurR family transcriptional regulator
MKKKPTKPAGPATLKMIAEYLGLSPATISVVINESPVAKSIPLVTRQRVLAAAKKFNYRANFSARSLRVKRTYTVGIIAPEHSEGYFTNVMMGIETSLLQAGYLYFTVSHLGRKDLLEEYPRLLMARNVDGFILINSQLQKPVEVPAVAISSHVRVAGLTNFVFDHERAAQLIMKHLHAMGHKRIALMKGQPDALDSNSRWDALHRTAAELGIPIQPELCIQLVQNLWSPELGYPVVRDLLHRTRDFTALICFNDIAALGALRAIQDAGLRCPQDISVVGFDDISGAAYSIPSLTTIRQPLQTMGQDASKLLVERINNPNGNYPDEILFHGELIVRESTSVARILEKHKPVSRKSKH